MDQPKTIVCQTKNDMPTKSDYFFVNKYVVIMKLPFLMPKEAFLNDTKQACLLKISCLLQFLHKV